MQFLPIPPINISFPRYQQHPTSVQQPKFRQAIATVIDKQRLGDIVSTP